MVVSSLWQSLGFFVVLMVELAVLFIVVSVLVGLLQEYVSEKTIRRALTRRWGMGNVLGAASGALTPFCSFSTIPVMVGLLRAGAPFGAVASFLLASPLVNPVVIGLFLVLFGWQVAVVYVLLGFVLAVVSGVLWEKFGLEKHVRRLKDSGEDSGEVTGAYEKSFRVRLRRAARVRWGEFRRALPYLVAGVAAGAVIFFRPDGASGPGRGAAEPAGYSRGGGRRRAALHLAGDDAAHRGGTVGERDGDRRDHGSGHRRRRGEHTRGERVGEHLQAPPVGRLSGDHTDYSSGDRLHI